MNELAKIKFAPTHRDFTVVLNKRVNNYFKTNNIRPYANREMILKSVCMFALYFIPYGLVVTEVVTGAWILPLVVLMGLGLAGIGLSVMHDANHGAYSPKKWVNTVIGYSLNLVGANAFNWKIQHNVLHHSYTNVQDADEDISPRGVLRLSPHSEWKPMHQYQFIYAWFLYGLMTIVWLFFKDFERMIKYDKNGLTKKHKASPRKEWVIMVVTKLVYIGYIFVIPLLFTSLLWWQVVLGIVFMHYLAGFILAIVFQPAHVVEDTDYPLPDEQNLLADTWTVHQLRTTNNYANGSRWFSWYVGGLNFQIEHHLFPNVCHVHYRKISAIVKSTADEFGLPYHSQKTFGGALQSHLRLLKQLGIRPEQKSSRRMNESLSAAIGG